MSVLTSSRYGKDNIRILRVVREDEQNHSIVEYIVSVMLEGDIDISYIQGDNSVVVATDSMKNTVNILAKSSKNVLEPEKFALELALHFIHKYHHIHKAFINITQPRWSKIPITNNPNPSPHSFYRDGNDKRHTFVEVDTTKTKTTKTTKTTETTETTETKTTKDEIDDEDEPAIKIKSGLTDLLILKSTGSSFKGFIKDEFTTLPETSDRIFSTSINLFYTINLPPSLITSLLSPLPPITNQTSTSTSTSTPQQQQPPLITQSPLLISQKTISNQLSSLSINFTNLFKFVRKTTLEIFANDDDSKSVQESIWKIARGILLLNDSDSEELKKTKEEGEDREGFDWVGEVEMELPNKHYLPIDLSYYNKHDPNFPSNNNNNNVSSSSDQIEVFLPVDSPNGLIKGKVGREINKTNS